MAAPPGRPAPDGGAAVHAMCGRPMSPATSQVSLSFTLDTVGDRDHEPDRRRQCGQRGGGGPVCHQRHHQRGCRRTDGDDCDRQQFQRRGRHIYPDGHGQCLDGQGHSGAGAGPGQWQLYGQGRRVGSGGQSGERSHPEPDGQYGGALDCDHDADCRGQCCQRGGGGDRVCHQRHHHRDCRRSDRDDCDRQQRQRGGRHLHAGRQRQCLVDHGHRGAGASTGQWQLYNQSGCVGSGRQPGARKQRNL